jgi:hypothetical protein
MFRAGAVETRKAPPWPSPFAEVLTGREQRSGWAAGDSPLSAHLAIVFPAVEVSS